MLLAALAVLAGIVIVASGRGGEMAYEHPDYPPLDLGPVTAADVALLRPPSAAWGYNMRVTDEALTQIARAMSERDVRISALEQRVSDLREELSRGPAPRPGARQRAPGGEEFGGEFTVELPKPVWPPATGIVPAASPAPEMEGQAGDQRSAPRDPADHWAGEHGPADERTQDDVPAVWPAPGQAGGDWAASQQPGSQQAASQQPGSQQPGIGAPDEAPDRQAEQAGHAGHAGQAGQAGHAGQAGQAGHAGQAEQAGHAGQAEQAGQAENYGAAPAPEAEEQGAPEEMSAPEEQPAGVPPWAVRSPRPGPGGNGGPRPRPRDEDETGD